jgi:ABC-2 type transport system ATP-binding protein
LLEARGLSKHFHCITAVRDVSFVVHPGEILGYLGPNGSGKTTTVNILAGLLQPSAGEILLDGVRLDHDPVAYKSRLGYVPELAYVYTHLPGLEYLLFVGRLRGIPDRIIEARARHVLNLLGLHSELFTPMASYSKGMRQKVLIAALLHNPDVVIFDEPLSGLDLGAALVFRNVVAELAAAGKIIFYSSHVLEVVEKLCSRVLILSRGNVIADDTFRWNKPPITSRSRPYSAFLRRRSLHA